MRTSHFLRCLTTISSRDFVKLLRTLLALCVFDWLRVWTTRLSRSIAIARLHRTVFGFVDLVADCLLDLLVLLDLFETRLLWLALVDLFIIVYCSIPYYSPLNTSCAFVHHYLAVCGISQLFVQFFERDIHCLLNIELIKPIFMLALLFALLFLFLFVLFVLFDKIVQGDGVVVG